MKEDLCFIIDIDRCIGCRACEVACKQETQSGTGIGPINIIEIGPREINRRLHRDFIPVLCMQCQDPECITACPAEALGKNSEGVITVDEEKCLFCGRCQTACPFGAIHIDKTNRNIVKCDLCISRRVAGWQPSCVQHCPGRALSIMDKNDDDSKARKKYSWTTGIVLYTSDKWEDLGEQL